MDRQVAYDLFKTSLEKKGIQGVDLNKDLPGLLTWGYAKGVFVNPHSVHELSEWRKLGDLLWEAVLEDDKTAKKLGKAWRAVHNTLLQHVAEKRAAERAVEAHKRNAVYGLEGEVVAPAVTQVVIPVAGSAQPSAPPDVGEAGSPGDGAFPPPPSVQSARGSNSLPAPRPDPVPKAQSDPWEEMVKQRREAWAALARQGMESGDTEMVEAVQSAAFPVTYTPVTDQQGNVLHHLGTYTPLDWKLLAQLRQTASQYGPKSEPVKQMLNYMFDTMLLLPTDLRGIVKLIFTQHQQLLFNAHWQGLVNEAVAVQRGPGDPLQGVTVDELMGLGAYLRTEAQVLIGPDKVREAMRLVRAAIDRVKDGTGIPMYMSIKQGRDESFESFVDKVAAAIDRAGVAEYMKGALLKQCALQNSNESTKRVLSTLGAN